jgi:hypothetical protein
MQVIECFSFLITQSPLRARGPSGLAADHSITKSLTGFFDQEAKDADRSLFIEWTVVASAAWGVDAGGTPLLARAVGDKLQCLSSETVKRGEKHLSETGSPFDLIKYEDRWQTGLFVEWSGDPVDILPVAQNEERRHRDQGVLRSV